MVELGCDSGAAVRKEDVVETNERGEQMVLDSLSGAESRGEVVEAGGNEEKILASVETKGRAEQKVLDSLSDAGMR